MKEFVEFVVKHLVDKPEEVQVNEVEAEQMVIYELRVGEGDMGKIIGKRGRTAQALRHLLSAVTAAKKHKRSTLEILE